MLKTARLLMSADPQPFRILTADNLSPFNRPGVTNILVKYHTNPTYLYASDRFDRASPITPEAIWADRSRWFKRTDPFWWSVLAKKDGIASKRTLRSYMARRVRDAVKESLNKRGYKSDGTRLVEDGQPTLTGTMQIVTKSTVLTMRYADIVRETDVVIEKLSSSKEATKIQRGLAYSSAKFKARAKESNRKNKAGYSSD
jgi:hypothetical protein